MLFDTHAHYDDSKFDDDRDEVIKKAHENGVSNILNVSCDIASSVECITLTKKYDFVYAAVGIHPHSVLSINDSDVEKLREFAKLSKVVGIGEIGLDYYYGSETKELQKKWFARQISLAREVNLPVIVHDRDAHEDTMKIIKAEGAKSVGGIMHCYSGSLEMARELIKQNFFISIAGTVTFKNARNIIEVVREIPYEWLLIETDCPYLSPEPFRGKRNDSSLIRYTAEKIAEIRGTSLENIAQLTQTNAKRLFRL